MVEPQKMTEPEKSAMLQMLREDVSRPYAAELLRSHFLADDLEAHRPAPPAPHDVGQLQRYSVVEHVDQDSDVVVVYQDDDGPYMDANDALSHIAALEADLAQLRDGIRGLPVQGYPVTARYIEALLDPAQPVATMASGTRSTEEHR